MSQNGNAGYSFEDIARTIGNTTERLGAAFFNANATGDLKFLKSTVGMYSSYVDNADKKGIYAM